MTGMPDCPILACRLEEVADLPLLGREAGAYLQLAPQQATAADEDVIGQAPGHAPRGPPWDVEAEDAQLLAELAHVLLKLSLSHRLLQWLDQRPRRLWDYLRREPGGASDHLHRPTVEHRVDADAEQDDAGQDLAHAHQKTLRQQAMPDVLSRAGSGILGDIGGPRAGTGNGART